MADALDRLRDLHREDAEPDPAARQRARAALIARIEREASGKVRQQKRRPLRRRRRRMAAVVAPAVAAALGIGIVTGVDRASVSPQTASALERAAAAAEVRASDLPAGKFLYVRERVTGVRPVPDTGTLLPDGSRVRRGPPFAVLSPLVVEETWMNRDGNGRYAARAPAAPVEFPGPRDRRRWIERGRPDLSSEARSDSGEYLTDDKGFPVGDGRQLTYEDLTGLPADGKAMYAKLIELAGDRTRVEFGKRVERRPYSADVEAFTLVGDLLRFAPVPARVRAALYRATARIKGIQLVGERRDGLGRRGQAVELEHNGTRSQLIFDPETSALLAQREVLADRQPWLDARPGYVTYSRLVERRAVVDSPRDRPHGHHSRRRSAE